MGKKAKRKLGDPRPAPQPPTVPVGSSSPSPSSRALTWSCAALAFGLTCALFWPSLQGEWLDWDDRPLLLESTHWRGLGSANLRWMFSTFHMGPYQPLSWLSYALDFELWGLDARGYHLTNVLLHSAAAACLFFVARSLFAQAIPAESARRWSDACALACALFWSLHPMRVESVAWITERRDCLSGLFLILALLAWLAHVRDEGLARGTWWWLALAAFGASLLAKGLGMTLPLALLALDVAPLRRYARSPPGERGRRFLELAREKGPFFLLAALAAVLAVVGQRVTGAMVESDYHDLSARVVQSFYGLAFYVRKTFWPSASMVFYPMRVPLDASEPRFVASIAAVVIGTAALIGLRRRWPSVAVAFTCFALGVAPVLGLVQSGSQLVADRYGYTSCLPLALLAGAGLLTLTARVASRQQAWRGGAAIACALAALVPFALTARAQIGAWRDSFSLWRHDLSLDPGSNPARRNLIVGYLDRGRDARDPAERQRYFEQTLEECRVGTEVFPDAAFEMNAAKVYDLMAEDRPAERRELLEKALAHAVHGVELVERTLQRFPDIYETCGATLCKLERPAEAVPYLEKLVRLAPNDWHAHGMLAEALIQCDRTRDALAPLEHARRLAPDQTMVWLELGYVHRRLGDREAAIEAYRRVLDLASLRSPDAASNDPDFAEARQALTELAQGR